MGRGEDTHPWVQREVWLLQTPWTKTTATDMPLETAARMKMIGRGTRGGAHKLHHWYYCNNEVHLNPERIKIKAKRSDKEAKMRQAVARAGRTAPRAVPTSTHTRCRSKGSLKTSEPKGQGLLLLFHKRWEGGVCNLSVSGLGLDRKSTNWHHLKPGPWWLNIKKFGQSESSSMQNTGSRAGGIHQRTSTDKGGGVWYDPPKRHSKIYSTCSPR